MPCMQGAHVWSAPKLTRFHESRQYPLERATPSTYYWTLAISQPIRFLVPKWFTNNTEWVPRSHWPWPLHLKPALATEVSTAFLAIGMPESWKDKKRCRLLFLQYGVRKHLLLLGHAFSRLLLAVLRLLLFPFLELSICLARREFCSAREPNVRFFVLPSWNDFLGFEYFFPLEFHHLLGRYTDRMRLLNKSKKGNPTCPLRLCDGNFSFSFVSFLESGLGRHLLWCGLINKSGYHWQKGHLNSLDVNGGKGVLDLVFVVISCL